MKTEERKMTIKDIKKKSKADLKNNYGISILTMILLSLVAFGSAAVGFIVGAVIVAGAVTCCYAAFYVDIAKHQIKSVDSTYRGFRQFARALKVMLIYAAVILGALIACALLSWLISLPFGSDGADIMIIVAPLLAVLFLIAIFFVSIKVKFVFYIMNDEIDLSAADCIKKSWRITKGRFGKILLFELSFIGWRLLTLLTLGAVGLYVIPYYNTSVANFYLSLTQEEETVGELQPRAQND